MNENNGILNINNAASRFCEVYKSFGSSLDRMGNEIYQLQSQIDDRSRRYNINGPIRDFFNDDVYTAESVYNALGDDEKILDASGNVIAEKYRDGQGNVIAFKDLTFAQRTVLNGEASRRNAKVVYDSLETREKYRDGNGNVIPFENLTPDEIFTLEDQAKQMNAEQGDVKLEIVTMRAAIDKKTAEFERFIHQNREQLRLANENLLNEKRNLKNQKNRIQTQIDSYEYEIEKTKLDSAITNKSQLISDYRRQISVSNIRMAILDSATRMADVYETVFNGILSNVSVDMYDKDDTFSLEEQYNQELSIADRLQKLVDGFNFAKENYSKDKEKIAEIEKNVSEFKEKYQNIANANAFIKKVNSATKSIKDAISKIEENNDIQKFSVDENGNVITDTEPTQEQNPDDLNPTQGQTPDDLNPTQGQTPEDLNPTQGQTPEDLNPTQEQTPDDLNPTQEQTPDDLNPTQGQTPEDLNPTQGQTPENLNPTQGQNPGNPTQGQNLENANNDPEFRVNRAKMARAARRSLFGNIMATTAIAGMSLGFLGIGPVVAPIIGAGAAGLYGLSLGAGAKEEIATIMRRNSATHKLKKIARFMRTKRGLHGFKLGEPDYENGTINFIIKDDDEVTVVNSSNLSEIDPEAVSIINEMLAKEFRNEDRGLGDRKPVTMRQDDIGTFPKVTIDNLQAAYAAVGGVRSFKDDTFGMKAAWRTASTWIGKRKDALVERIHRNKDDVEEVQLEETEESLLPMSEEEEAEIPYVPEETDASFDEMYNALGGEQETQTDEFMDMLDDEAVQQGEPTVSEDVDADLADLVNQLDGEEAEELRKLVGEGQSGPSRGGR